MQRIVIELKLRHKSLEQTLAEGLQQTADYVDRCAAEEAHLIIFDRRPDVSWDDRIWQRTEKSGPKSKPQSIQVWGA